MGEFNSVDHYIYYCVQKSLRRNGVVAIMVNKRVQNAVLGCNLKNDRMISVPLQGVGKAAIKSEPRGCGQGLPSGAARRGRSGSGWRVILSPVKWSHHPSASGKGSDDFESHLCILICQHLLASTMNSGTVALWGVLIKTWKWKWSHSVVSNSVIPWAVAHQAPPSMGFSRQEYWSGLPFPSPGDLPDPGIEPRFPTL